ncbi:C40 family peptidase [Paenibacillus doosanensis]|nr:MULTISPECIES: C40 family peptidase [Paenibacillus]MCS7459032.1 C40 family peptidase [Paenibacillus doosanensis]
MFATTAAVLPTHSVEAASATASSKAQSVISIGKKYLGVPYKYGATAGSTKSFDCSSFTQYVYKKIGISLPRTSKEQSKAGTFVARKNLKAGDLVFFYSPVHHVAIYIGNGKILHTYGEGGVKISNLNSGWWNNHYQTARRVIK